MDKRHSYNRLTKQVFSLLDLAEIQVNNIEENLKNSISDEKLSKIRHIIMTGSGDSLLAAEVAVHAFEKFASKFGNKFEAITPIEASRYYNFDKLQKPEAVLVVGISASGGPARVKEVLARANKYGFNTLAVTNNKDSVVGKEADDVLVVGTPEFDSSPGLRSYYASQVALFMLAAKFGEVKGISYMQEELKDNILKYTKSYEKRLPEIYNQLLEVADNYKDSDGFAYIGDDLNYFTTYFAAATMIEVSGHICTIDDSESWCHVNYFVKPSLKVPVIFNVAFNSNSLSRVEETIEQAVNAKKEVMLVINGQNKLNISDSVTLIEVPQDIEGYEFLAPLMNHAPTSILASLVSEKTNEPYFRGDSFPSNALTIQNSEIVIIKEDIDE